MGDPKRFTEEFKKDAVAYYRSLCQGDGTVLTSMSICQYVKGTVLF